MGPHEPDKVQQSFMEGAVLGSEQSSIYMQTGRRTYGKQPCQEEHENPGV